MREPQQVRRVSSCNTRAIQVGREEDTENDLLSPITNRSQPVFSKKRASVLAGKRHGQTTTEKQSNAEAHDGMNENHREEAEQR